MSITSVTVSGDKKEKWLQRYARFGLASHGVVYTLMSLLAFMASLGLSNKRADKSDAFRLIHEQPFGKVMIAMIAVGLLGYVLLRFFQAFRDTRHKGKGLKGLALRASYAFIAFVYLALSIYCFRLAFGQSPGGDSRKEYTAQLLDAPAGRWLVGAVALIFAITACQQIYWGLSKSFMKIVELYKSDYKKTFTVIGMIGYTARGLVFGIIAYLFLRVAIEANSDKAEGTGGAFQFLQQNFGNLLMGITALGLLAFGLFMFVRAKHEKMSFDMKS